MYIWTFLHVRVFKFRYLDRNSFQVFSIIFASFARICEDTHYKNFLQLYASWWWWWCSCCCRYSFSLWWWLWVPIRPATANKSNRRVASSVFCSRSASLYLVLCLALYLGFRAFHRYTLTQLSSAIRTGRLCFLPVRVASTSLLVFRLSYSGLSSLISSLLSVKSFR